DSRLPMLQATHKFFSKTHPDKGKEGLFEFVPVKAASRFIGKEFFFVPGRGYWPLPKEGCSPHWDELPLKKTFKEDDAARLIENNYNEYLDAGPIFLDPNLHDPVILDAPQLSEIKIHKEADGWFYLDPRYGSGTDTVSMIDLMRHARKQRRSFLKSGNVWLK